MESMSEILKKKGIPINTSEENMATWSTDELEAPTDSDEHRDLCPVCQGAKFIHPLNPSGEPDYSRLIPCRCTKAEIKKKKAERLQSISNLGHLTRLTFENLLPTGREKDPASQQVFQKIYDAVKAYAENPERWLILVGPVGSGKTHLASAVANYRISRGYPVFYITVADLLDHLRSAFSPNSEVQYDELFEQVKESPLLILDNLNTSTTTAWAKGKLDQLLEFRFNSKLPTLITTSTSIEEFSNDYAGHINDTDVSKVLVLKKEASGLQNLDSLDLELLKNMKFKSFNYKRLGLPENVRQNLEEAYRNALDFAQSPQGWLIFQGLNGCGKTHLAAAIANHLREAGKDVLFIVVPDLLDHLRSTFGPDSRVSYDALFEKIKKIPVLILDDFGQHSATPWAQEKLYQLINYRYNAKLPTVITTCLDLDDIESRVSSRMVDPTISLVFNIIAPDYRGDLKSARNARSRQKSKG
ncbi:MAG: ATP-binding protein [Chloroflexi bacterium]|nr:ATP-binding protein [Chloroflexota bacterium]